MIVLSLILSIAVFVSYKYLTGRNTKSLTVGETFTDSLKTEEKITSTNKNSKEATKLLTNNASLNSLPKQSYQADNNYDPPVKYPKLKSGKIADAVYFQSIQAYVDDMLKKEMMNNSKLEEEFHEYNAFMNSGYREYELGTLQSLAKNGDINASIALIESKKLDENLRIKHLQKSVSGDSKIGYLLFALREATTIEEKIAFLMVAQEKGSELANFNLKINKISIKENGIPADDKVITKNIEIARKKMSL